MSLRSRSLKASIVLTSAGHLFIHNYIISLLNNILRPILMVRYIYIGLSTFHVCDALFVSILSYNVYYTVYT